MASTTKGRQFDAKGNLRDWWTEKDAKAFDQRADCLVQQYGNFSPVDDVKSERQADAGREHGGQRRAAAGVHGSDG